MTVCCRCNAGGKCRNCVCVKSGRQCTNCLPSRNGCCSNMNLPAAVLDTAQTPPAPPAHNQPPPSHPPVYDTQSSTTIAVPIAVPDEGEDLNRSPIPIVAHHSQDATVAPSSPGSLPPSSPLVNCGGSAAALPETTPMATPTFTWGDVDAEPFTQRLDHAYSVVVHWRRNVFAVPSGKAGTGFVSELSRLFLAYAEGSALESIALKAAMTMCALLLQKPNRTSKSKDHVACLERRMTLWRAGDLEDLLQEGQTIQRRLSTSKRTKREEADELKQIFAREMSKGNTKAALRTLSKECRGTVLNLNDIVLSPDGTRATVLDILKSKHPPSGGPPDPDTLIDAAFNPPVVHPVIFDSIQGQTIRSAALHTSGAAGPSGIDAWGWRRLCSSFKSASAALCQSLALLTRKLCTVFVDPDGLAPLMSCRLIALNKNPGVRPIGICEVVRRIVAKAILSVTTGDIQQAAGSLQLCAGQKAGSEAAVHSMNLAFKDQDCEAVLFVDASNAFNSLNRQVALRNIRALCPPLATALINTYRRDAELFVDGKTLYSQEGTTHMPMYSLATLPLIEKVNPDLSVIQSWFADDATAAGSISKLRDWWDALATLGPMFGYHVNASKTHLVVKDSLLSTASAVFADTKVNITSDGRPHLGVALGTSSFTEVFVKRKVEGWSEELLHLSSIAETHPQAAYAGFTHGLVSKWTYLTRTIKDVGPLLQPLEDIIKTKFLPALSGKPAPSDEMRDLFGLPCRLGGLGIVNPTRIAAAEYAASKDTTDPIVRSILYHNGNYTSEMLADQLSVLAEIKSRNRSRLSSAAANLRSLLSPEFQRAMDLAQEKGASTWLTVLPVEEFGFSLHKGAFRDALALRYGWSLHNTPSTCSCGTTYSVEHALSCAKGGYPTIRHNEIRDFTAHLMTEVCHNVAVEPHLQPLTGEALRGASSITQDGARLDVAADGFWGSRFERAFFDVRVFNPYAPSNQRSSLPQCYRNHENIKKRAYDQRIREVEHGTFSPLVFSCTGGMGRAAATTYKRLASLIAAKRDEPYSMTMGWIRCRLSFSLLRAAIMCVRGVRSSMGHAGREPEAPLDLVSSVGLVPRLE